MIIESKYQKTPIFGIIAIDSKRFNDCDLFKGELWKYAVLKKIKVWWGTPKKIKNMPKMKTLLGIQCKYKNIMTGEEIESEAHCGNIGSNDIIVQEINLKQGDYFNHFQIGFDTAISFIKFTTKNDEKIEFGEPIKDEIKKVKVNMGNEPNMVQCFIGYYNENCVNALGCKFIKKKDYIFLNIMDILRLRHFFKVNKKEREKWLDNNKLNNCSLFIKTIAKLCLLPEIQFNSVIKFCL
jgi:hypothetical protein